MENSYIEYCFKAKNINAMTNLNDLNMINCDEIKDIGNLRKIKKLIITTKTYGLHFLKELEELKITKRLKKTMSGELNKLLKINNKLKIIEISDNKYEREKEKIIWMKDYDFYEYT